jgi:hypothetical protein
MSSFHELFFVQSLLDPMLSAICGLIILLAEFIPVIHLQSLGNDK